MTSHTSRYHRSSAAATATTATIGGFLQLMLLALVLFIFTQIGGLCSFESWTAPKALAANAQALTSTSTINTTNAADATAAAATANATAPFAAAAAGSQATTGHRQSYLAAAYAREIRKLRQGHTASEIKPPLQLNKGGTMLLAQDHNSATATAATVAAIAPVAAAAETADATAAVVTAASANTRALMASDSTTLPHEKTRALAFSPSAAVSDSARPYSVVDTITATTAAHETQNSMIATTIALKPLLPSTMSPLPISTPNIITTSAVISGSNIALDAIEIPQMPNFLVDSAGVVRRPSPQELYRYLPQNSTLS